jgi:hypothetical protein
VALFVSGTTDSAHAVAVRALVFDVFGTLVDWRSGGHGGVSRLHGQGSPARHDPDADESVADLHELAARLER